MVATVLASLGDILTIGLSGAKNCCCFFFGFQEERFLKII